MAAVIDTSNTTTTRFSLYSTTGSYYDISSSNAPTASSYIPSSVYNVISRYIGEPNNTATRYNIVNDLNDQLYVSGTATNDIDFGGTNSSYFNGSIELRGNTIVSSSGFMNAFASQEEAKREGFRLKIRNQLIFVPKGKADPVSNIKSNEAVAIETLREMISEEEFKRFIARGFITVQGRSGKTYQIFRNNWHTKVWVGGKLVEEICVRISGSVKAPATDNLIAFKAMIEADEEEFRKIGNVYKLNRAA